MLFFNYCFWVVYTGEYYTVIDFFEGEYGDLLTRKSHIDWGEGK